MASPVELVMSIVKQLVDKPERVEARWIDTERTVELIVLLQKYALGHFAREEAHMHRVGCPTHKENCAAHAEFADKLAGWLELLTYRWPGDRKSVSVTF